MNRFPFLLARWESRQSLRRVGVFMLSISLGVAALVAVRSFREDVARSVERQAQALMGADLRLSTRRPLPDSVERVVDSLVATGRRSSRVVTAGSMVVAPDGTTRLMQLRGVDGDWPFYGGVVTRPDGLWGPGGPRGAVVDPAALTQLGVEVGDTLRIGGRPVPVRGVVEDLPTSVGFQTAVGPRIFLPLDALEASGILGFGSLARYQRYLELPDRTEQEAFRDAYRELFRNTQVDLDTADEEAANLTDAVGFLARYLGLVGLGALLLGGIGVGSAIHVFVKERLTEVAVLRCLGARQASVFSAYLLQASGLGLLGALVGVGAGMALQHALPGLLASVLPVDVQPRASWETALWGLATGLWVSLVFALLPLLTIRDAPPLRALRQAMEVEGRGLDRWRLAAVAAVGASVLALSVAEAPSWTEGLAFAAGLAFTTLVLWAVGRTLVGVTRRLVPTRGAYVIRQGLSNLFRPRNQTVAVVLALGFGSFIVGTVLQLRTNLSRELALDAGQGQPNLLAFDIQEDQRDGVLELLPGESRPGAEATPLVSARIRSINGRAPAELLGDLPEEDRPSGWALRREYRNTFRDTLTTAETLVAGDWWSEAPPAAEGVARISVEADLAEDLGVGVGDVITWDVSGIPVESRITSLRTVDWNRFQTNFFVVFEPGGLDGAPATWVVLTRVEGSEARAGFQRRLVERYPNVSVLDVTRIQEVVDAILSQVTRAIGFLALFAAVAGGLVLVGSLASSRHQRLLEGALLRTLGARRPQILGILFAEYLALGLLATVTGLGLAGLASWSLVEAAFDLSFSLDAASLVAVGAAVTGLTVVTGLLGSRQLLRRPPLPVLRGD